MPSELTGGHTHVPGGRLRMTVERGIFERVQHIFHIEMKIIQIRSFKCLNPGFITGMSKRHVDSVQDLAASSGSNTNCRNPLTPAFISCRLTEKCINKYWNLH